VIVTKTPPLSYNGTERGCPFVMKKKICRPCGIFTLAYIAGIFTALVLPVWLLAVIEGALIIVLGCTLLRM